MNRVSNISKVLLASIFSFLFISSLAQAFESTYPAQESSSIYLYNALENQYSVEQLLNNKLALVDSSSAIEAQPELSAQEKQDLQEKEVKETLALISAKQKISIDKADRAMRALEGNVIKRTVLGSNIGTLEFELVQIKGLRDLLRAQIDKTVDVDLKIDIKAQIEALVAKEHEIETVIDKHQDEFSFLGWLVATL